MKITMDGKYAYRKDPFTQVRILCVDRSSPVYPVVTDAPDGNVRLHKADGAYGIHAGYDLVPLQKKLPDLWVVVYEDGGTHSFRDKSTAEAWVEDSRFNPKLYKYIPAPDQTS